MSRFIQDNEIKKNKAERKINEEQTVLTKKHEEIQELERLIDQENQKQQFLKQKVGYFYFTGIILVVI